MSFGKNGSRKLAQSLMFLPYFISFVLVGLIAYNILSYDFGLLNGILKSIGWEPLKTYSNPTIWPFIIVITFLWQSTGYGSIVYFAAIMGLDSEIVEAAEIDGANALAAYSLYCAALAEAYLHHSVAVLLRRHS